MKQDETKTITNFSEMSMASKDYERYNGMSTLSCSIKRSLDMIGSLLGLILTSPVFLLIYFLILLFS